MYVCILPINTSTRLYVFIYTIDIVSVTSCLDCDSNVHSITNITVLHTTYPVFCVFRIIDRYSLQ